MKPKVMSIIKKFAEDSRRILKDNIVEEYLFGSYASETETPESDIDLLLIVQTYSPEIQYEISGLASDYSIDHDVFISPIVRDVKAWEKNRQYDTLFYREVMENRIRL